MKISHPMAMYETQPLPPNCHVCALRVPGLKTLLARSLTPFDTILPTRPFLALAEQCTGHDSPSSQASMTQSSRMILCLLMCPSGFAHAISRDEKGPLCYTRLNSWAVVYKHRSHSLVKTQNTPLPHFPTAEPSRKATECC